MGGGGARAVGGQFISVAGGLSSGVEYVLDGANHMNYAAGSGNALPFPDALQEFNVRTSGLTADAGRGEPSPLTSVGNTPCEPARESAFRIRCA